MLSIKFRWILLLLVFANAAIAQNMPLPEHPRPDFERANWINLNGVWDFEFDSLNTGLSKDWQKGNTQFGHKINVPFPWGSPLSGVKDLADYAWYKKSIQVPRTWTGQRIFLTVGASDYETSIWLDGVLVGKHQGGYTPFSFELTKQVKYGTEQQLVIRVDDKRRDFALYGKQGYGNARGIWQTIYLEGRGQTHLESIHFTPDIDKQTVKASLEFSNELTADTELKIRIKTAGTDILTSAKVLKNKARADIQIAIPNPRLWNLEDPFLYETEISLGDDKVKSYFGMRKISVMNMPNTKIPYVALNNQPIYLQLTLDQSYHPDGFYTFPTDAFMKNEIILAKEIGLNGIRTHIKVDVPRKLYWADKLGLLVMSDLPNAWGEPDAKQQTESEYTLREMIKRDYNHPSIFSWITFNETWGLQTKVTENGKTRSQYLPQTQNWVASMYYLAKSLDPSRLVEDNSVCCGRGHTETDINSWHEYLPGWAWEDHLANLTSKTFEGSEDHFEKGFKQGLQPNINSECGNVWGYDGSTGDVDWSWDYHRMINTFRKYPKVAGWLYTEHHDVINEWNGYWRFDRTKKYTGLSQMMDGMSDKDFHSAFYISTGNEICKNLQAGTVLELPLYLSVMTGTAIKDNQLVLEYDLDFLDKTGESKKLVHETSSIPYQPWMQEQLPSLTIKMPNYAGLGIVQLRLKDKDGKLLHSNFMHVVVKGGQPQNKTIILEQEAGKYFKAEFSSKVWKVLDGLKVNGAGKGFIEYQIPVPANLDFKGIQASYILVEASAKQLFDKDRGEGFEKDQDYMLGAKVSPHKNPNAYPMTDESLFASVVKIQVNGKLLKTETLPDDPADHRGVLSWNSQLKDKKLREAGSYGYLIKVPINKAILEQSAKQGYLSLKLSSEAEGGIAIYGADFGRYPINPSIVIKR